MTPRQVQLVQETFHLLAPDAPAVAALFYERLFTLDPSLRPLFRSGLEGQGKKLIAALSLVTCGLDRPEEIMAAIRHLGQRHLGYGVQPEDYETFGEALLWSLGQGLKDAFTGEVAAAWLAAYDFLTDLMLEAAQEVEQVAGL